MTHHLPSDNDPRLDAANPDLDPDVAEADFGVAGFGEADVIDDALDDRDWLQGGPGAAEEAELGADGAGPAGPVPPEADASSFLIGADAVRAFVAREWKRKLDYRLKKEVWSYGGNQVSILFEYEWHDAATDQWMLTDGEEVWEIATDGLLHRVKATGQDIAIAEINRWILPRPITGPTPVD